MPTAKSKREIRKGRRDKKKPKSENYRKGGPPIHFNFFCKNEDLDVLVRKKLAAIEGKTDEDTVKKRSELEDILANLPSKIPPRHGPPFLEGERDHYYARFFHLLTKEIMSDRFYKSSYYCPFQNGYKNFYHTWKTSDLRAILAHVNYFDHGADYPGAHRPPARRRVLNHLRHMRAKRAKADAGK
jgi:hypothetical protein